MSIAGRSNEQDGQSTKLTARTIMKVVSLMGKKKQQTITALYERLSHDDELQDESNSISNQKRLLEEYAKQQGFSNVRHYTDDTCIIGSNQSPR